MNPIIQFCVLNNLREIFAKNGDSLSLLEPAYGGESVGLDLYNAGETLAWLPRSQRSERYDNTCMNPVQLMSTGIKVNIPKGYVGIVKERSSIVKTPLSVRAGVIDPGFTGELKVAIAYDMDNRTTSFRIDPGSKSPFQLIVVKAENTFVMVSQDDYEKTVFQAKRQNGMIGSTG